MEKAVFLCKFAYQQVKKEFMEVNNPLRVQPQSRVESPATVFQDNLPSEETVCQLWAQAQPYLTIIFSTLLFGSFSIGLLVAGVIVMSPTLIVTGSVLTFVIIALVIKTVITIKENELHDSILHQIQIEVDHGIDQEHGFATPENLSPKAMEVYELLKIYAWQIDPLVGRPNEEIPADKKSVLLQKSPTRFEIRVKYPGSLAFDETFELNISNEGLGLEGRVIDDFNAGKSLLFSFDPSAESNRNYVEYKDGENEQDVVLQILATSCCQTFAPREKRHPDCKEAYKMTWDDVYTPPVP